MNTKTCFTLSSVFLIGCATIDSGSVDYRRAESINLSDARSLLEQRKQSCQPNVSGERARICSPMLPARLDRKFVGKAAKSIRADDVYSIRLDYGVIAEMNELPKIRLRKGNVFGQNGEIAVLVKAFEFSAEKDKAESFLDFNQKKSSGDDSEDDFSEARVVYFNPDVDNGQALNMSNIPILGPVKYTGRPVGLQIIVLELDRMSEPVKSMLQNLAGLGRSYANAGPVTDALFDLGTSLVEGSQDDIIFEYRMVMDNTNHTDEQVVSPFEEGRLVFRRAQNRSNRLIWRNLRLDENTGALYTQTTCKSTSNCETLNKLQQSEVFGTKEVETSETARYRPYTSETYFVVNIINHGENGPEAFYEFESYGSFQNDLQLYIDERDAPINSLNDPIVKLIAKRQSQAKSEGISNLLEKVADDWEEYSLFSFAADFEDAESCELHTQISSQIAKRNLLLSNAQRSTYELYASIKASQASLLEANEKSKLLSRLSSVLLGRLSNKDLTPSYKVHNFTSWGNFWAVYGTNEGSQKFSALFKEASETSAPSTCSELKQLH